MTDPLGKVKTNWRIAVLLVLIGVSLYFLFVPGAPITGPAADVGAEEGEPEVDIEGIDDPDEIEDDRLTNLQYGIQLDGGARISAPVIGYRADVEIVDPGTAQPDPDVVNDDEATIRGEVAAAMNIGEADVRTYTMLDEHREENVVEVRADGDPADFAAGLQAAGYDVSEDDIQRGVTGTTRDDIVEVLDTRIGEAGFAGGSVTQSRTGEEVRIVSEAPGQDLDDLEQIIAEQGLVETVIHYPDPDTEEGYQRESVLRQEDMLPPGAVSTDEGGTPYVPVTLTEEGAQHYHDRMMETGFATEGPGQCTGSLDPGPGEYCIMTVVDGEVVWSGNLAQGLADSFVDGTFLESPRYRMTTTEMADAQELRLHLLAGELPAELDLERANSFLFSPSLAEGFKTNSLFTGILAVLAVVLMVFLRYGDPRVAAPMSATALSEVLILLGFAAAIGWPLDLSHVAGFIAVVGTGVDDLIIIADEVMSEGEVSSHHVFDSRFKKAFWIIGAAAATTIIAMSPLAIMDLGDLRGFAIVTIIGVIIGVAITRPAYGNILRGLKTEGK